ncbi:hypothetical protein JL721_156 [Aureococcus anophagefferens]|nr:hypothetical protein JL721_156 [Aureococcus anophagefferens]
MTPMERQIQGLLDSHRGCLLVMEVGYKYRVFGPGAENAAKALGLVAWRDKHFMTCSFPTGRLAVHVRRLVRAGFRVAVARQTDAAALKARRGGPGKSGTFDRAVNRVFSASTLIFDDVEDELGGGGGDSEGDDAGGDDGGGAAARWLVVGADVGGAAGLAAVDLRAGAVALARVDCAGDAASFLAAAAPRSASASAAASVPSPRRSARRPAAPSTCAATRGALDAGAWAPSVVAAAGTRGVKGGSRSGRGYLVELKKRDAEGLEAAGKINAKTWFVASETKDLRRYVAPAVGDLVDALRVARERAKLAARAAFGAVAADADARLSAPLARCSTSLAPADALRALGALAREPGWVLPALGGPAGTLSLRGLRHPTLVAEGGACVANDVELRAGDALVLTCVLTGPNAGGKSSIARAVALAHVFAQAGGPVPCERADMPLRDAIFTRMGAADDLAAGASTFLAELRRAALPLNEATAASFVILDELGRGTSTHDGVAVAAATLAHLVDEVRATTLFITHYHDLAKAAAADHARVRNVHVAYARVPRDDANDGFDDDIVMLYKLEPGLAASFISRAAHGVPPAVLDLARAKVGELRGAK